MPQPTKPEVDQPPEATHPVPNDDLLLSIGMWSLLIVAAIVGYGLTANRDQFLAIGYLVIVIPALLFSIASAGVGRLSGKTMHPGMKVGIFFIAAAVMVPIAILVVIWSVFTAVMEFCFGS